MDFSRFLRKEWEKIDKRRTGSLMGFLVILAFFPVIFSSSGEQRISRTEAATAPVVTQQQGQPSGQPSGQPPQGQQGQLTSQPAQGIVASIAPSQIVLSAPEPYSPQPSIWLFLIPVAVTFFTILFY